MKLYRKRAMEWSDIGDHSTSLLDHEIEYSVERLRSGWAVMLDRGPGRQQKFIERRHETREAAKAAAEAHWRDSPVPGLEEVEFCEECGACGWDLNSMPCPDCDCSGVVVEEKP